MESVDLISTSIAASGSLISAFHDLHTPWFDLRPAFVVTWPCVVNGSAEASPKAPRTWDAARFEQFEPIANPARSPARRLCECPGDSPSECHLPVPVPCPRLPFSRAFHAQRPTSFFIVDIDLDARIRRAQLQQSNVLSGLVPVLQGRRRVHGIADLFSRWIRMGLV